MIKNPWLAHPWLSLLLAMSWLLLQNTLASVHLLSAVLIGLIVPRMLHQLLPPAPTIRMLPALRLALVVIGDIVTSNITVAKLVLGPISRPQPAWIQVPLQLQHPTAISLLASIITTTPGTVSSSIDEEQRYILVHALDCSDTAQLVAEIKQRYERPLLTIFGETADTPEGEKA